MGRGIGGGASGPQAASGPSELIFVPLTCGYLKTRTGGVARRRASL
jgi:hypothetical protein